MENDEIYPEPGTACRHFNMIEMLKVEENKKKGGIGVSSKTKPVAEAATTSKATTKPTASGLLAVKAEEKRKMNRTVETKVTAVKSVQMDNTSTVRCSTTDEELEALFQQLIGKFLMILKLLWICLMFLMTIQKHQRKCRKNWRSSNQTFIFHLKMIMKWRLQMTKKMKK